MALASPSTSSPLTKRARYLQRRDALRNERSSWEAHWRELAQWIRPRRGRFLGEKKNDGSKRNGSIINGRATKAVRILQAGMMSGITSPARPWFRLTTPDPDFAKAGRVALWLHQVEEVLREIYLKSNFYQVLPLLYGDLAVFGTAPMVVEEDHEDVIRCYLQPCGFYALANSARLEVDTLVREVPMTVAQLVEMFPEQNLSQQVKDLYARNQLDQWMNVVHFIEPNRHRAGGEYLDSKNKAYRSCWLELVRDDSDTFLRESGYDERPFVAPRWLTTGEDVYGESPAMDVLGDIKALQTLEKRKAHVVDLLTKPPMRGPSNLKNGRASILPGEITYVDAGAGGTFEPAMTVHPQALVAIRDHIGDHGERIEAAFHADVWMMMAESDRRQITAREIDARREEKMQLLGPVLDSIHKELLAPFIDRTFAIALRRGLIPEAPAELAGVELKVDFISVMAQALKALGAGAVERQVMFTATLAQATQSLEALDNLDQDKLVHHYADMLGIKPDLLRSEEAVAERRAVREQAAAAMQQSAQVQQGADAAKTLSEVDTESDNALTRIINNLGGPAAAA